MIFVLGIIFLLLEGLISNFVPYLSFYFPFKLFLLLLYLLLLPFLFRFKKKDVLLITFLFGFLYDLCYTDIFFLHPILFYLTYQVLFYLQKKRVSPVLSYLLSFYTYLILYYAVAIFLYKVPLRLFFMYLLQLTFSSSVLLIPIIFAFLFFPKKMVRKKNLFSK